MCGVSRKDREPEEPTDRERFPYRYEATFTVVIEADGQHADGDGAAATVHRVGHVLANVPRVVEVGPLPHPRYVSPPRPVSEEE